MAWEKNSKACFIKTNSVSFSTLKRGIFLLYTADKMVFPCYIQLTKQYFLVIYSWQSSIFLWYTADKAVFSCDIQLTKQYLLVIYSWQSNIFSLNTADKAVFFLIYTADKAIFYCYIQLTKRCTCWCSRRGLSIWPGRRTVIGCWSSFSASSRLRPPVMPLERLWFWRTEGSIPPGDFPTPGTGMLIRWVNLPQFLCIY